MIYLINCATQYNNSKVILYINICRHISNFIHDDIRKEETIDLEQMKYMLRQRDIVRISQLKIMYS